MEYSMEKCKRDLNQIGIMLIIFFSFFFGVFSQQGFGTDTKKVQPETVVNGYTMQTEFSNSTLYYSISDSKTGKYLFTCTAKQLDSLIINDNK